MIRLIYCLNFTILLLSSTFWKYKFYPEIGSGKAITRRYGIGRRGMRIECVDIRKQRRHDGRHAGAHVLGGKAREVTEIQSNLITLLI